MRRSTFSACAVTLAAACVSATAAAAQNAPAAGPEMIPRELAEALLRPYVGFSFNGGGDFVVGKVPPLLAPYLYVPPDAHVIGGIQTQTTTIAVFTVPIPLEQVRLLYAREEPKLGWTQPPAFDAMRGWGFMPAPGTSSSGDGYEYCHIGQSLRILPSYSTGGSTQITATVQNFGGSRCGLQQPNIGGRPVPPPGAPTVFNPDGSQMIDQLDDLRTLAIAALAGAAPRPFRTAARGFGLEGRHERAGGSTHLDSPGHGRVDARTDDHRPTGDERCAEHQLSRSDDDRPTGSTGASPAMTVPRRDHKK